MMVHSSFYDDILFYLTEARRHRSIAESCCVDIARRVDSCGDYQVSKDVLLLTRQVWLSARFRTEDKKEFRKTAKRAIQQLLRHISLMRSAGLAEELEDAG